MDIAIVDAGLQVAAVLIGVASLIIPLHQQNKRMILRQGKRAKKALRAIRRHERDCAMRWEKYNSDQTAKRERVPRNP